MSEVKNKKKKSSIIQVSIGVLAVILAILIIIMMGIVSDIQGTARIVNYTGLVRGETQGHTKIAYIGETQNENRYAGYCSALADAGISVNQKYIANIVHSTEEGYKGVHHLLNNGCDATAFFCADDITAIGAMKAIKEHGLHIPEDVSVASIDDIDTAQYLTPPLTTTHIPLDEMGQMAAKVLIDRIEGGHTKHLKILFPYDIMERKSTAALRKIHDNPQK